MNIFFRATVAGFLLLLLLPAGRGRAQSAPAAVRYGRNPAAGGTVRVNGIRLYYESYGTGPPVLLLHGNGGSIRSSSARIEALQAQFRVVAVDCRAHGQSGDDPARPLTYELMADDVAQFLDSLHLDSVRVFGQSDGGIIGLLLALHHPRRVARLATYGVNLYPGGKAVFRAVDRMVRDTVRHTRDARTRRLFGLLAHQPHLRERDLRRVQCPVLLMYGDRDVIRPEHALRIFQALPRANLFVMPGASHFGAYEQPALFRTVLLDFLTQPFRMPSSVQILTGKP